jgi:tetratricopeptide (TPR) repeat protein
MRRVSAVCLAATLVLSGALVRAEATGRHFEWTTKSAQAKKLLAELQSQIENFQVGPGSVDLAKRLVAADPGFAMGHYYEAAVTVDPVEAGKIYDESRELAKNASDGERRFIEAMVYTRVNQGVDFRKSIEPLEELSKDYPGERLIWMVLGQLYNADAKSDKALVAFQKAQAIGPSTARAEAFLAAADLMDGNYAKARGTYESIERRLPKGSVPFTIRFGITFSHLYEGHVDEALESLRTYLAEYKAGGLDKQFPEVFVWNAMARINLENGRLEEAMNDYKKGFESVPGSNLPEDQKKTWLGRLHHGTARTLAKMGKIPEAWAEAETVRKMIEEGGEPAKQYWPAYHYVAGYVKLEAGEYEAAKEQLEQADMSNPFDTLLLARAYEKLGRKEDAKKTYQKVVESQWAGIERPLAYPEAKRKLQSL